MKKNETKDAGKADATAPQEQVTEVPASAAVQEASEVPDSEPSAKKTKAKAKADYPDFLKNYIEAYPHNRVFYVTTDRMVFLAGDRGLAILHQNSLGSGEVETYTI